MRRISLAVALLALAGTAAARAPKVSEAAPDFTVTLRTGEKVRLADLRGQVVVLNFWATWCVPCRAELPLLDAYYKQMKRHGMRMLAITTEGSVPASRMKALFAAVTIEPIRDVDGPYRPIGGAVPTNFIIDRAGRIRYAKAAAFDSAELNSVLVPLLNEPPPPS